jgi:hypothetical protein
MNTTPTASQIVPEADRGGPYIGGVGNAEGHAPEGAGGGGGVPGASACGGGATDGGVAGEGGDSEDPQLPQNVAPSGF